MNGQSRLTPGPVFRIMALVAAKPHVNRLVDDALIGLKDDNGQHLKAE